VLGSWIAKADARADRFRSLFDAYGRLLVSWDPAARPFVRNLYDGAHVLAMTAVDASGQATGPTPVRLWRKALDGIGIPAEPAGELGNPESDGHIDAVWLLEVLADVGQSFALRRNRAEVWPFAQRVRRRRCVSSRRVRRAARFSRFRLTVTPRIGARPEGTPRW
jgi:hypothetical protein